MASEIRPRLPCVHQIVLLENNAQIKDLAWRKGATPRRGRKTSPYAGSYFLEKTSSLRSEYRFKTVLRVQFQSGIADVIEDRMRT